MSEASAPTVTIEKTSADGRETIKVITETKTNDKGEEIKVVSRVRVTRQNVRVNKHVRARRQWEKFGAAKGAVGPETGVTTVAEDVFLERPELEKPAVEQPQGVSMQVICRKCGGEHWTRKCPLGEDVPVGGIGGSDTLGDLGLEGLGEDKKPDPAEGGGLGTGGGYVPPHLRGGGRGSGSVMPGSESRFGDEEKASVRVTNLSEDANEHDLHDLFRAYGQIARVSVPKDRMTGLPRGFAFVDFYNRVFSNAAQCDSGCRGARATRYR